MKECQYCKEQIKDEDIVCIMCGYNHKAGTINNAFKEQMAKERGAREKGQRKKEKSQTKDRGISSSVNKFVFVGLIITVFALFYKHNFNISSVVSETSRYLAKLKKFKFSETKTKDNEDNKLKKIELTDVNSFKGNNKPLRKKDLKVEGIFFDPQRKSFVSINGQILSEGESAGDVAVKNINRDSVELIIGGERKTLQINQ